MKPHRLAGTIVWTLALCLFALACVSDQAGNPISPVAPVCTLTADELGTQLVADIRSNGNVTVIRTSLYGRAELREVWNGIPVGQPRVFAPGRTYVWRREPSFSEEFSLEDPLPAWVGEAQGLWHPGEAEALGYTFDAPDVD